MMTLVLLLAVVAGNSTKTELTYTAARGTEIRTHRLAFDGSNPGAGYRVPFENAPHAVANLPLWLPEELRKPGSVIYDDGEGFKDDRGQETYILSSLAKWNGGVAAGLYHAYQGMQESDNWVLEARYDTTTGYLQTATVSTRFGESRRVLYDLALKIR